LEEEIGFKLFDRLPRGVKLNPAGKLSPARVLAQCCKKCAGKRDGGSYHIDYCFVPESWTKSISAVELGGFDDWVHLSDHVPLIVEVSP
jgi:endonuclease/exonuclease/phosphatase family metal-dependent hydrolase